MKYKALLFDLDGTLLYSLEDLANAVNFALEKHGYPSRSLREIEGMIGSGVRALVERALPEGADNPDYGTVFADFSAFYREHCLDNTRPYDGVLEMLSAVHAQGALMAIVTNKTQTEAEMLRQRFFADTVPVIAGDSPERAFKPAPDAVLFALDCLGVSASDAVYVGDTEVDRQTAENSGTAFVATAWGYRGRAALEALGVQVIADRPEELTDLL